VPRVFPGAHDERAAAGVPADEASGERIAPARGKRRHAGSLRELDDHPVLLDAKSRVAMGAENDDVRGRGVMPPFVLPPRPVVEPPRGSVVHVPLGHVRTAFEDHGDVAVSLGVEGHESHAQSNGGTTSTSLETLTPILAACTEGPPRGRTQGGTSAAGGVARTAVGANDAIHQFTERFDDCYDFKLKTDRTTTRWP
jgi:hypothetical protein